MKYLLAAVDATNWILPVVLLVLVIGLFVLNYFRNKKYQENAKNIINNLKVGDTVKTYSGFYGKIVEINETTDGKVAVLETGAGKNKGYMSIDMNAIYAIDEKKPVVYDAEGNIVSPEPAAEQKPVEKTKKAEKETETKKEEIKLEEKPVEVKETEVKKEEIPADVKAEPKKAKSKAKK